jgi:alpha-glucosidase (family GH31 glycosyl hydrolase)
MRDAIFVKYSLLRYFYTNLFLLSVDPATTGTFYKPMFFEYPNDPLAYQADPSENLMLGFALKVSIKTSLSASWTDDTHPFYFPGDGNWCDIIDPTSQCVYKSTTGTSRMVPQPSNLTQFQVFLREGHILPYQNAKILNPKTSEDLKKHSVDFLIHPRNTTSSSLLGGKTVIFEASGVYVNDDGVTPVGRINQGYNHYAISFQYRREVSTGDENIKIYIAAKAEATRYYNN